MQEAASIPSRLARENLTPDLFFSFPSSSVDFDFDSDERLLRSFDLNSRFGPCTGMSRLERWERAQALGLDPPQDVRKTLLKSTATTNQDSLWEGRV